MLFLPKITPKKKQQLIYLLLFSLVLIVIVWLWWVSKFGYQRKSEKNDLFFNFIKQRGQSTVNEYDNLKNQLQSNWQQIESAINQSKKQVEIIDKLKERIPELVASSSTSTDNFTTDILETNKSQEQK